MDKEDGKDKLTGKDKEVSIKNNVTVNVMVMNSTQKAGRKAMKMPIRRLIISTQKVEEKAKASEGTATTVKGQGAGPMSATKRRLT